MNKAGRLGELDILITKAPALDKLQRLLGAKIITKFQV